MDSIIGEPGQLFSSETMPCTPVIEMYGAGEFKWFGSDREKHYSKRPHPVFGPEDITYQINSYGYRCLEFDLRNQFEPGTFHVVTVAASDGFGTGLPEDNTYPTVFKELLQNYLNCPVANWNVSLAGGSADYIARTLISALPLLKPDLVLLNFPPGSARREYIDDQGYLFECMPTQLVGWTDKRSWEGKAVLKAHRQLLSAYNNPLNLFKNYKVCESLCEQFGVMWLFSTFDIAVFEPMKHLIHEDKLVGPGLGILHDKYRSDPALGLARDMIHPGIQPEKEHAECFFERFRQVYGTAESALKKGGKIS